MGLAGDGTPVLQFMGKDGEPMWTAPSTLVAPSGKDQSADAPAPAEPEASEGG
jgi:hypothetical protein